MFTIKRPAGALSDDGEHVARVDLFGLGDVDELNRAGAGGCDRRLHLHHIHNEQLFACGDCRPCGGGNAEDHAGHGSLDLGLRAGGQYYAPPLDTACLMFDTDGAEGMGGPGEGLQGACKDQ